MKRALRFLFVLLLTLCLVLPANALTVPQALALLDMYYIDPLPDRARSAGSVEELMEILGDPYTTYMTPEVYTGFLNAVNGSTYVGIGVTIEAHERGVVIDSVLDGSPAQEAGLAVGDVITAVGGVAVTGPEHARALLLGEAGTPAVLTVLKVNGSAITLEITRREVLVRVTMSHFLTEDGDACVIMCGSFGETTPDEFVELLDQYEGQVDRWIIDLSENPGGSSRSGAASAGCFIGEGTMLFLRDGDGAYSYTTILPGAQPHTKKPALLLISEASASAAEMFTAAVRDFGAGISLGQRTYGKGVAQVALDEAVFPELFHGDALKITAYRFFSPNGVTNDQIGVLPTLMTDYDKTYYVSLLLSGSEPSSPDGHLSVGLSGWTFYVDLKTALSAEYRPALVELLEALPPYAVLRWGEGERWQMIGAENAAQRLGLTEYQKRTFTDLADCPQREAIETLCTYALVSGDGNGSFRPNDPLTRAEFCAMLGSVMNLHLPAVKQSSFTDVDPSAWYAPVVNAMLDLGLLSGYGDGTFRPESTIAQEEAVSVLSAVAARLNMTAYDTHKTAVGQNGFVSFGQYSAWAKEPAWLLTTLHVDLSRLSPQESATRALAADLLCQVLTQTGVLWK